MVERVRAFWRQFQEQGGVFFRGLTKGRKIALGVAALIIVFVLGTLMLWKEEVNYEVAFTNLSKEDKTAILAFLKKSNISDFELGEESISFPENRVNEIRMALAQEGLPSTGLGVGWDKFDSHSFGMTDFDQRINKLRAIQGELQRTINSLEPVDASRVHIVSPEAALFANEQKQATASVFVRLKRGATLSQRQLQGILNLVARAVEGLQPENITVVDQEGNMLTKPEEKDDGFESASTAQREYQRRMEQELTQKIRQILARVVGPEKVVAQVQADLDFKKVETTIQDVDPERSAVVSSQRSESSTQGNGLNPTGVPGAKSNLPGEKEDLPAAGGSSTASTQSNERLNFEFKKTLSKVVEPVGTLKGISAAVLVDYKQDGEKFVERTPEEITKITNLVKSAIGFKEGRDQLTVQSTQFELDEFDVAEKAALDARKTSLIKTSIIALVAIAALIFLFFAVVRPYFRWLTFNPDKASREQYAVVDYELERSGQQARRVQVQEEVPFEKLSPREQIMYLARHDPEKTTEAIRHLLSPGH